MGKRVRLWVSVAALVSVALVVMVRCGTTRQATTAGVTTEAVELPGGKPGIGFDDVQWSDALGRVIVPGGRTGKVFLIDPDSLAVTAVSGFSKSSEYDGGHDFGVTSAVEGEGFLYAVDRTTTELVQVDLASGKRVHALRLQGEPDYVRFIAGTHELWVTEPHDGTIEVVELGKDNPPSLRSVRRVEVPRGPEALVIDADHGRAYTNSFIGTTYAVDLRTHEVVQQFDNDCALSLGMAVDAKRRRVYVACAAGSVGAFAADTGAALGRVEVGFGVDIIAYDARHRRVLAPSTRNGQLTSIRAGKDALGVAAIANAARDANCVVADEQGRAWVCDPKRGRMLRVTFPL